MKVLIPTPLRSYTGQRKVEASGATLARCSRISTAAIPASVSA